MFFEELQGRHSQVPFEWDRWLTEMKLQHYTNFFSYYLQGLETLLNDEQLQEWKELYEMTDTYTDNWLTAGILIHYIISLHNWLNWASLAIISSAILLTL